MQDGGSILGTMKKLGVLLCRGCGVLAAAVLGLLLAAPAAAQDSFSGRSPTCGPINGQTQQDLQNVRQFCSAGIPSDLSVEGAYATGSLLWIKIPRSTANIFRALDSLDSESVMLNWMKAWKQLSGSRAVTVYLEWQEIEIAKGETTLFSGDKVTIRR